MSRIPREQINFPAVLDPPLPAHNDVFNILPVQENHFSAAGIEPALRLVQAHNGPHVPVEIEVSAPILPSGDQ